MNFVLKPSMTIISVHINDLIFIFFKKKTRLRILFIAFSQVVLVRKRHSLLFILSGFQSFIDNFKHEFRTSAHAPKLLQNAF